MSDDRKVTHYDWELRCVQQFHDKFGVPQTPLQPRHLSNRKLQERIDFLKEELDELQRAADRQDLAEIGDALIDLVYVAKGTALMAGLPWEAMWAEVQRANMAKERGPTKRGHRVDVCKPEGWVPPDHVGVLKANGYDPSAWSDPTSYYDDPPSLEVCGED